MNVSFLALMLFVLAVSGFASLAGWMAEEGLRRSGLAGRWSWLLALGLPAALVGVGLVERMTSPNGVVGGSDGGGARFLPIEAVVELPALVAAAGADGSALDLVVGLLWGASTLLFVALLFHARARLLRDQRGWEEGQVLGRRVLLSAEVGPAVTGLLRPSIVLPRWALALPDRQLRLVLGHEEAHVRAGDSRLLASGLAFVALAPWNPVAWWQLRRLRLAMEIDCDRRVLGRTPDVGSYGESLLAVAGRGVSGPLALTTFLGSPSSLERRILAMTRHPTPRSRFVGTLLVLLAVGVGAQACGVEPPLGSEAEPGSAPSLATDQLYDQPTFTPFTEPPQIINRDEVIAALEAEFPPLLREAGIEGTVRIYFLIDEEGAVRRTLIAQSSGHDALDQAALRVAEVYRFVPAGSHGEPVPVWVSFPITFRTP